MTVVCDECGFEITPRNCLCEDWRDPDKSFGCPQCGTFYRRGVRGVSATAVGGIISAGIGVPAGMLIGYGLQTDSPYVLLCSTVIILTLFLLLYLTAGAARFGVERSGYQSKAPGADDADVASDPDPS